MTLARLTNNLFPSVPSFTDKFFNRSLMDFRDFNFGGSDETLPAVNMKENDNELELEVAAPGMKKSDFRLNYENGRLIISSEKSDEKEEKDGERITRHEFRYSSFQRSFTIPQDIIHADKISAKYKDGILKVTLPKQEKVKAKPVKEIKVS